VKLLKVVAGAGMGVFLLASSPFALAQTVISPGPEVTTKDGKDGMDMEKWQIGLSASYLSGSYGTDVRTNTLYVPLSIRRLFENGDITLIIPYVRITSNGNVTFVNGFPVRIQTTTPTTVGRTTNEGLGDMILQGRYYVLNEREYLPSTAITAHVEAPTGDESRGLGLGDWDEGLGLELSKHFSENWVGFLDGGYTIIGNPKEVLGRPKTVTLEKEFWNYDVGLGYYVTRALLTSVFYEEWRSLVPGAVNARDVLLSFMYKATQAVRFQLALEKGLTSDAPDYGITAGVSFRF
jgi:outer membrane putative beta-barrel porin/alpha-amylase